MCCSIKLIVNSIVLLFVTVSNKYCVKFETTIHSWNLRLVTSVKVRPTITLSNIYYLCQSFFTCVTVHFSVCLLDRDEIFWRGWAWPKNNRLDFADNHHHPYPGFLDPDRFGRGLNSLSAF